MSSQPARKTAAKRPDDVPFDFNLDAAEPDKELIPFTVHWGGRRFELTHLDALDVWGLMDAAEGGERGAIVGIFRTALGDTQWKDFRAIRLPSFKLKKLFDAYRVHCGVNPDGTPLDS